MILPLSKNKPHGYNLHSAPGPLPSLSTRPPFSRYRRFALTRLRSPLAADLDGQAELPSALAMLQGVGMAGKPDLTAVYVILGQAILATETYDAKGAFVLLNSIVDGLGDAAPSFIHAACHLHIVAALGDNETADQEVRRAMVQLVGALEQSLARASR